MTSGFGSVRSHSMSFRISFRWKPRSPCRVETVISPSDRGCTSMDRFVAIRSAHGASKSLSAHEGRYRNNGTCCCNQTLMPPKNTRLLLTFSLSVRVGVYMGTRVT